MGLSHRPSVVRKQVHVLGKEGGSEMSEPCFQCGRISCICHTELVQRLRMRLGEVEKERDELKAQLAGYEAMMAHRHQVMAERHAALARVAQLENNLHTAVDYLMQAKAQFAPHTDNSFVDIFIEDYCKSRSRDGGKGR